MMTKRPLIITLFLMAATCTLQAQNLTSDSIDVYLKTQVQTRKIPALQMAVVRGQQIEMSKTYGSASLEHNVAANDNTLFYINSITKAFVGVAVMQLVEAGKLNTKDPISKYLDSLPVAWQQLTIRQLLSHTSGMPDILDEDENVFPRGEKAAWARLLKLQVVSAPGEKFSYNQAGYVIIGKIITKLSGMHFTRFIEEKQFKAVGMSRSRFGDSFDVVPNSAGAYTMNKFVDGQFVRLQSPGISYIQFPEFYRGAAGIMSTAREMALWVIALKKGTLISKTSLDDLWKPSILNNGQIGGFNSFVNGYALGWPTVTRAEHPAVAPVGGGRNALAIYLN
ncbi:MAG: class A beta-lactamase-related serine hydrolase, partial [Sphingobacteriales bacterium]